MQKRRGQLITAHASFALFHKERYLNLPKNDFCKCRIDKHQIMRNWCRRLIQKGIMVNYGEPTAWKTTVYDGMKLREPVQKEDEEDASRYFSRRAELYSENYKRCRSEGASPKEANSRAWSEAYKTLWAEFGCCYYYCKGWTFTAYAEENDDLLQEIYSLARTLAPTAPPRKEPCAAAPPQSCNEFKF